MRPARGSSVGRSVYSVPEFLAFRAQSHVFEDMVGYARARVLYSDGVTTLVLPGAASVTTNTFEFYGVSAAARGAMDHTRRWTAGAPAVFIMSERLWRAEFGSDPNVLGATFVLNDEPRTLVGIMPRRFDIYGVSLWIPADVSTGDGMFGIVGRIKRGVSLQAAGADLDVIAHRLTKDEPRFVLNPAQYAMASATLADVALGNFKTACTRS